MSKAKGTTYNYGVFTNEVHYVYDGMRAIQERDGTNTPLVSYTRGTDLSGAMEGAGGIGGLLARSDDYSSGNWTRHNYYHADGNGNIMYLETSSQGLAASYRYDAFGETVTWNGSLASANTYMFSSKERIQIDPQGVFQFQSLYYYGYRFYAPHLQRWLNRDPIRELGFEALRAHYARKGKPTRRDGDNLFEFAENNPITKWDYLGLDSPGCDFPATSLPCILPGAADCYLRCCAQHDTCLHDNGCKARSSWAQILCPTKCGHCARQALGCFGNCLLGGDGAGNPPYYCAAHDSYYYNWDDIPADCWVSGNKPAKPDCYP